MKQIHFHALKEDLLPALSAVESKGPVKYVLMGNFLWKDMKDGLDVINCGEGIPNLGKATSESWVNCDTYLVCEQSTTIKMERFKGNTGVERVCIDQLMNPDTVTFNAGGMWKKDVNLQGRVATVSDSEAAQDLMKRFHRAIKKNFVRIRAFYVGPMALALMQRGARLTMAEQCPREYDLTP
jgi:hypothetical protein